MKIDIRTFVLTTHRCFLFLLPWDPKSVVEAESIIFLRKIRQGTWLFQQTRKVWTKLLYLHFVLSLIFTKKNEIESLLFPQCKMKRYVFSLKTQNCIFAWPFVKICRIFFKSLTALLLHAAAGFRNSVIDYAPLSPPSFEVKLGILMKIVRRTLEYFDSREVATSF